ncbi:tetratricopeptide repeat protein [Streptomyces sp. NPDC053253]|uniref:tetratricopeptide repeat protein n=1 Tax=Streptomyces sp. NPDC053253 TaxID=3365699 RepID=UPI0037D63905
MTGGADAGRAEASGDRAVAAGGDIGWVHTGDRVTVLPAEALTVSTGRLVHLPERTQLFVGRARELALLDEGSGIQVICGLGGIGKSTLAARWAAARTTDHAVVWWITAETPAELDAGLADLARAMQPGVVGVLPEDALRERALQWLATHDDWLLVLDNVSDPADLRPLLARVGSGRIVVTSRRASGWQDIGRTVVLDVLGPAEAAELFAGVCEADGGLDALCAELGYLPLALKQSAAYCAEAGITPRAYLDLLSRYPAETFALTAEGGEAGRTVARVWQVTLDRLQDTPLAGRILGVLAWWAPEGIPRRLLEPLGTPLEVTEAVRRLRAHSMITLDGAAIGVHRVVQAVVRAGDEGEGREAAGELLVAVAHWQCSVDEIRANPRAWQSVVVQIEALARYTEPDEDTREWVTLFEWAGLVLGMAAAERTILLLTRALNGHVRRNGAEDDRALGAMRSLTVVIQSAYGYPDLPEEFLALHIRAYGPDDPRTIEARAMLAGALLESSRGRAEELLRENVDRAVRSLGEDARETLSARCDLIAAGFDRGVAAAELELLLARARGVLAEGDGLVRIIRMALISALLDAGRTERALALSQAAAEGARVRFGAVHPEALISGIRHATALWSAGEVERAREMAREMLSDLQAILDEGLFTQILRQIAEGQVSSGD